MKICIPTEEKNGLDSLAYGHLGSAPYFLIYDTVARDYEILDNGNAEHEHGQCNPISPLMEKGVNNVVVAGMGARALVNLNNLGIQVFRTTENRSIKDVISDFELKKMEKLTFENSCNHHNCQ